VHVRLNKPNDTTRGVLGQLLHGTKLWSDYSYRYTNYHSHYYTNADSHSYRYSNAYADYAAECYHVPKWN
jgi:hypothetical protein